MERIITEKIKSLLPQGKIILLVGQRQVGKTYELNRLVGQASIYIDFEDEAKRALFSEVSVANLESILGQKEKSRLLLLDEIQNLPKSGSILKLIHDHFPQTKVIATGSASFLLLRNIGDSLYGRHYSLNIFPLTVREIIKDLSADYVLGGYGAKINKPEIDSCIKMMLIYGGLPDVVLTADMDQKKELLKSYLRSLLFKDIFEIEGIRLPQVFKRLLLLLAHQVGSEVNISELAGQLEVSRPTVLEYIHLYEKFHIIYTLTAFSNNPRKEVSKGFKVYFTDLGVRNALIENFGPVENRGDMGALFENLVVNLIRMDLDYFQRDDKMFFWRNFNQSEVDLVILNPSTQKITPVEIKYSRKAGISKSFLATYGNRVDNPFCINKDNLWQYI